MEFLFSVNLNIIWNLHPTLDFGDKLHWHGVVFTGEKYLGYWSNNMKHGCGLIVTLDGIYYEGVFTQDVLTVSLQHMYLQRISEFTSVWTFCMQCAHKGSSCVHHIRNKRMDFLYHLVLWVYIKFDSRIYFRFKPV